MWHAILGVILLTLAIIKQVVYKRKKIVNKKVLIVGGSSGLGLAFAKILREQNNEVTITSRNLKRIKPFQMRYKVQIQAFDTSKDIPSAEDTAYDYIFCCPGKAAPGYFMDQKVKDFEKSISLNYLGTVRTLKHFLKANKTPFHFIMIGSTVSLFTFPGYGSYAPTKSALLSLFYTIYDELSLKGVQLHLYNTSSISSPGFSKEERSKPAFTKSIESLGGVQTPEKAAKKFLQDMHYRRVVSSDFYTHLLQICVDCESLTDCLLLPIAKIVAGMTKLIVRYKFYYFRDQK